MAGNFSRRGRNRIKLTVQGRQMVSPMGNILDYIEQEKQSFTQYPFCAVDSLVLSRSSPT